MMRENAFLFLLKGAKLASNSSILALILDLKKKGFIFNNNA